MFLCFPKTVEFLTHYCIYLHLYNSAYQSLLLFVSFFFENGFVQVYYLQNISKNEENLPPGGTPL